VPGLAGTLIVMAESAAPPAAGVRVAWEAVPARVRLAVEQVCGSPVAEARTQPGGFSPGVAARVVCADGRRHFVKAVSGEVNKRSVEIHRRERDVLTVLGPVILAAGLPVARLRGSVDLDSWVALILDDVDGRHPAEPWDPGELRRVVAALDRLASVLTPSPIDAPTIGEKYARAFTGWRRLAESGRQDGLDAWSRAHLDELAALEATWAAHAAGDTLLHSDVRADNILLTGDGVVIVDWPAVCRGAAFADLVFFAPSVAMQGGPDLADLLALSVAGRSADQRQVAATVCALGGYFTYQSLQPAPPGLPTIRAFQAAQGEVTRRWLARLL
jgi:aminoglycoside phosphotransferase (APT) family kinase protein